MGDDGTRKGRMRLTPGVNMSEVPPRDLTRKKPPAPGPTLEDELYEAVENASHGQPVTSVVAGNIKLAIVTVLSRHGIQNARIAVNRVGHGFDVQVQVPTGPPTVREIRMRVGQAR